MSGLVADYERWLHSWGAADKTVKARVNLARGRLAEWGLAGFTPEAVTEFLARDGLSAWTRSTYHANLRDFCAWLVAAGHLEESPMEDPNIRKPKRPKSRPRPLSEPEVAAVLRIAHGRTRDWILLAMCAGLRAHEIAKLRGEDVDASGIYVKGKGGVEDTLPCHPRRPGDDQPLSGARVVVPEPGA
jgi:integrase/recombinase XerD